MTTVGLTNTSQHICAIDGRTGQRAHITAAEMTICEKVADVVFRQSFEPIPHNVEKLAEAAANPGVTGIACWTKGQEPDENMGKNVKRVIINYYIPLPGPLLCNESDGIPAPYRVWTALISTIGSQCRKFFPNLSPEESCFNVHIGLYHYHERLQLLPGATPEHLNLT